MAELEFFEVGARTALICDDGPTGTILKDAVEGLDFKCHLADSAERAIEQLSYTNYDLIVIGESFAGSTLESNTVLAYVSLLPMAQRRNSYVALIGDSLRTLDAMQAFTHSVHLVINPGDIANLSAILRKGLSEFELLYTTFRHGLVETGESI